MIEFILGLMIVISFFFFYVRMSAVFAVGNYIHYATFMAARAYASGTTTRDNQVSNANNVLQASLGGRFKSLIKASGGDGTSITGATIGPGPYFADPANQDAWNQGVTFHFTSSLSIYPFSQQGDLISLDLTSESWMPREETEEEVTAKKSTISGILASAGITNVNVEWDNGL